MPIDDLLLIAWSCAIALVLVGCCAIAQELNGGLADVQQTITSGEEAGSFFEVNAVLIVSSPDRFQHRRLHGAYQRRRPLPTSA